MAVTAKSTSEKRKTGKPKRKPSKPAVQLELPKATSPPTDLSADRQVNMLRQMLRIRRLEERCAQLYQQRKFGGFCHLYIGQEAVAVGTVATLNDDDYVLTTYRDHGFALVRGITPSEIFAELMGRVGGTSKGRGGSMHLFKKETHFLGGHAIVGGNIPIGTGVAFASRYRDHKRVTICVFGEGAVNNGQFHEALNMAALWKLPIVYICENNRYGMGTPIDRSSSLYDIHLKADGYDMDHECIDGQDLMGVYTGVKKAVDKARGYEPSFLEIRTYRYRGHSMSDPIHSHYRTKEEVDGQRERDPIEVWRRSLIDRSLIGDAALKQMDNEIQTEIKQAVAEAEQSPEPSIDSVYDCVLVD